MSQPPTPSDRAWPFWPIVPIYPYGQRRTLRQEVVKDSIWTFDQLQGILYVIVPVRMTVLKLAAGGLLVYAPVAPTRECIRLVNELVAEHGAVKYIILPTSSGLEHKVFAGPFARQFPQSQVFVTANPWSFPLDLPLSWLGLPLGRTQVLPENSADAPFGDEFDYAVLGPIDLGLGPFEEVALFHRRSRTLLLTDSILAIPEEPPPVLELDPYPLLFHARETVFDPLEDSPANRAKGWQRIALFGLFFRPSALDVLTLGKTLENAGKAIDRSKQAYFGLLPWRWRSDWKASFDALRGGGRLLVAPILQTLILDRQPEVVQAWVEQVARWRFQQIIPCHFAAPLKANPQQLRQAFKFLEPSQKDKFFAAADLNLLKQFRGLLDRSGIV